MIGDEAEISLAPRYRDPAVALLLVIALRVEVGLSQMLFSRSEEALLLSILGFAILIAGVAEVGRFSAAVGALLAGIMLPGLPRRGRRRCRPLRDLFAAIFFAFIGLSVDPSTIPPVLGIAVLGLATSATKYATGWWSARHLGSEVRARGVVGAALIPRGEFSIAIAGLAAAASLEDDLGPVTVAYVIHTGRRGVGRDQGAGEAGRPLGSLGRRRPTRMRRVPGGPRAGHGPDGGSMGRGSLGGVARQAIPRPRSCSTRVRCVREGSPSNPPARRRRPADRYMG